LLPTLTADVEVLIDREVVGQLQPADAVRYRSSIQHARRDTGKRRAGRSSEADGTAAAATSDCSA
jgi:hypothetical protein